MSDQAPDPNALKNMAAQLGQPYEEGAAEAARVAHAARVTQAALQAPPGTLAGVQAAQHAQPAPGVQTRPQARTQALTGRPVDPLSRPYRLPSGGLLYPGHDGTILIAPMRGEQEEILAGIGEGPSASPAIRHVVQQCIDPLGIEYEDLELTDWSGILLHLLAMSAGTDEIPLRPVCPRPRGCGNVFDATRMLGEMVCRVLRLAGPGEEPTWPPTTTSEDDDDAEILRDILGDEETDGKPRDATTIYTVAGGDLEAGLTVRLSTGDEIGWRYLRVRDQVQAEQFAERTADHRVTPESKLYAFLNARMMVSINGRRTGVLNAMQWVKTQPSYVLAELREDMGRKSFGYEMAPRFRCTHCSHSFRKELPLDGHLFRQRSRSKHRRAKG